MGDRSGFWGGNLFRVVLAACLLLVGALQVSAQKVKEGKDTLDDISFARPELRITQQVEEANAMRGSLAPEALATQRVFAEYDTFLTREGGPWQMLMDRWTGRPALVEGKGIPWIPGAGNSLTMSEIGLPLGTRDHWDIPQGLMAEKALKMVGTYPELFGADPSELRLMTNSSGPVLDYLYYLHFQWTYQGVPVEGAYVVFRLNSGNLVQFGSEGINPQAIQKLYAVPSVSNETAWQILWGYLGRPSMGDTILDPGHLSVVPFATAEAMTGMSVPSGSGVEYRLVYTLSFRRADVVGTWEAKVDAHTGEILSFLDSNRYGSIKGGVYKTDQPATEISMPFPYADYSGTTWADVAGNYTGTTGTSTMTGRTGSAGNVGGVDIVDTCGTISLASDGTGLINFGVSAATDCSSPGGGAGNTRASRTQYYNVSMIKIKAYTYLPTNTWLQGRLTDRVNLNQTCNAYWDGSAVNFFRKGTGGCWNTGELPGVSLHEWAHGLDANDGSPAGDRGTGETYGDFSGTLQTHGSCAGGGFFLTLNRGCGTTTPGYNCSGYGDCCLSCSGIRELDYAKHASGLPTFPEDLTSNVCTGCTTFACSASSTYAGPCGREGHCESLVSSQAMWDLPVRDLVTWGMDATSAWQLMDKLWYASRTTSGSAYACPSVTTANGCGTSNYFTTFRVVDDCDGNLANGTPHATAIFAAFNRHKIGCTTAVNTDNNCGCATLATPVLAGTAGDGQVTLTWGAVTGATSYDVYRNDAGCTSGFTFVANTTSLTLVNSPLSNGVTYYYRIQAKGTGTCPSSPMSNCVTLTPAAGGCTAPGAPTLSSATGVCTGVNLVWTAGTGTTLAYNVYRFTGACGGAYTKLGGMPVTGLTYSDTTAVAGTSYAYVVRGTCDAGGVTESANSNCLTATRTAVPAAPTGVTATAGCTGNSIAWTNSPTATSHNVLRGTTCGTVLTTFTGVTTPYNDTTAVVGTTYNYWVVGINTCGTSANSSCATAARIATPAAPTGVTATAGCTGNSIAWTNSPTATSHNVLRGTTCGTVVTTFTAVTTPYNDTTAVAGTAYQYWVVGVNACGTSANSSCAAATRLAVPAAPTGVTATPGCTGNSIAWTNSPTATSHNVLRGTTCGTVLTTFTGVTTPYNDTTAVAGTTYNYWVVGLNTCGTSANSTCATAASVAVPVAPTGVTATAGCTGNSIAWTNSPGATSHNVLRGSTCGTVLTTFTGVTTPYNDTTAVVGTTYNYWVVGLNACGTGANSSCATAARLATPAAPTGVTATPGCTGNSIAWTNSPTATSHNVLRGTTCGTVLTTFTGVTTPYNDTTAVAGTTYNYWVVGLNTCGTSANSSCATAARLAVPAAPTGVTATPNCTGNSIAWTNAPTATSHNVLRGTTCGTVLTTFTGVTTPYNDTTAVAGTTYNYWVVGLNTCGTSANSSCATAARLVSPVPTITGGTANTCPALTVLLTTEAGMSAYQWYIGGTPIGGAISNTYTVTASGSYTVSYTAANGCSGTSAAHAVTITPCAPNIVYSASGPFTQITGNGDAWYDLGEKWSVQVTLGNAGNLAATAVTADLAGNGITVCGTGTFGAIPASGTANFTYEFVISSTFAPCGGSVGFDIVNKACTELTPAGADQLDVFSISVGKDNGGSPTDLPIQPSTYDTYVDMNTATTNYGTNTTMLLNLRTTREADALVQFDLSGIPAGATVNSATLELYNTAAPASSYVVAVNMNTATWNETAVTWNTKPAYNATNVAQITPTTAVGWKIWTVTSAVQDWVNGTSSNYGFTVRPNVPTGTTNVRYTFATRENATTANRPILRVNYTPAGGGWDCTYVGSGTCATCAAPSGLTNSVAADADPCAPTGVAVNWTADATTWGDSSGTRTYDVLRDGTPLAAGTGIAYGTTTFTDTTAVLGTSYLYAVRYNNGCGMSATTAGNSASDLNNTPAAPTAVTATAGCTGNSVAWTNSPTATSHNVLRGTTCGTVLTTFTGVTTPYNDTTAVAGTTYNYWVVGVNACGTSANSSCATAARLAAPAAPAIPTFTAITDTALTVNWTAVSGATTYDVWRATGGACAGAVKLTGTPIAGTTYPDSGLVCNTAYSYYITANNTCGTSANGTCGPVTTAICGVAPPEIAPGTTPATSQSWTDKVTQTWPSEATATGYTLYRGTRADLPQLLNSTTDSCTRYTGATTSTNTLTEDPSLVTGLFYWYLVTGSNANGEGPAGTATAGARIVNSSGVCP